MTNTFSLEVSKKLRELNCEGENIPSRWVIHSTTEIPQRWDANDRFDLVPKDEVLEVFPTYQLHDVIRLMPKIGEVMGWKWECNICETNPTICSRHRYSPFEHHSHRLLDAFRDGDYPKAEEYLISIITKEHGK